jgi:tetratricopeptide (TPR) repeat protein
VLLDAGAKIAHSEGMKRLALIAALFVGLAASSHSAIKIAPPPKKDPTELLEQSRDAFLGRDFDKAIKLLSETIKDNPKLAPALVLRGLAHAAKEDYQKAADDFTEALKLEPKDDRPLALRAATYQTMRSYDKAIEDFSELIKRKPNEIDPLCSRGMCYLQASNEKKAFEDFDKAVSLEPRNAIPRQIRGSAHAEAGRKTEALTDYKEAITLDPNNPATYLFRAHVYVIENQMEDAVADFEEALRRAPDFSGAANDYAWTLATNPNDKVRDGRKAIKYAKDACHQTDYKHAPTIDTLAASFAEAGEWEDAVKWQEEATKLAKETSPKDVKGMNERLLLYKEKRPYREDPKAEAERLKAERAQKP